MTTDVLDGWLARKFGIQSQQGRLLDSLGDKSFFISVIISLNANAILGTIVSWAIIIRELAMYIIRLWTLNSLEGMQVRFRQLNLYGLATNIVAVLGLYNMYTMSTSGSYAELLAINISAYVVLFFGVIRIIQIMNSK